MVYEKRAKEWYSRSRNETDEFVKFLLLFISLEVSVKLKFEKIRSIKKDDLIKRKFYAKIDHKYLTKLKHELESRPLENVNPKGDNRWSGKLNSETDFDGIIEFVIRARNNLFHGYKGLDEKRDLFVVKSGITIMPPLVEAIIL